MGSDSPNLSRLNPGRFLAGRYRIIAELSQGGFSQTFLAEDLHLPGRPRCVVKQLKPPSEDTRILQTSRRLFETEAKVLEKLGFHTQIPSLLAYFEEDQEFYLVLELIEGESLAQELATGERWPESEVIKLLLDILSVLKFVHQQNVIHRDIKPSNMIRRFRDGKIVLIDFGAVKQTTAQTADPESNPTVTITIGTQGYMPNEQLAGHPRFSSDVYAVGMIGIQALTGIKPRSLELNLQTGEVNWRPDDGSIHSELAVILDRMVRYHFRDRYPTAAEALQALDDLFDDLNSLAEKEIEPDDESQIANTAPYPLSLLAEAPNSLSADESLAEIKQEEAVEALNTSLQASASPMKGEAFTPADELTSPPDSEVWRAEVIEARPHSPSSPISPVEASHSPPPEDVQPVAFSANPPLPQNHTPIASHPLQSWGSLAQTSSDASSSWPLRLPAALRSVPWKLALGIGTPVVASIAILTALINAMTSPIDVNSRLSTLPCETFSPLPLPSRAPDYAYPDGVLYYGPLNQEGLPTDGQVSIIFPDGDHRYDGELLDGKRHGCGTLTFGQGRRYEGQFQNDHFHGQGIWTLENGDRYIGAFRNGKCQGRGAFVFANGDSKQGIWWDGRLIGSDLTCD